MISLKILSIDTSSTNCSVAILEDNNVLAYLCTDDSNNHSVSLMPLINQIFQDTNLKLEDIDVFACDKGPGSFTGIRIGVSTIKAFSDVTKKTCIGISSLKSLAYTLPIPTESCYVCSLIDAKHENCYCGIFKVVENGYYKIEDYFFDSISNIINKLKNLNKKLFFCRKC